MVSFILVAPQGFTGIDNKNDIWIVREPYPYMYPHNKITSDYRAGP
jgi:hypothetical protein